MSARSSPQLSPDVDLAASIDNTLLQPRWTCKTEPPSRSLGPSKVSHLEYVGEPSARSESLTPPLLPRSSGPRQSRPSRSFLVCPITLCFPFDWWLILAYHFVCLQASRCYPSYHAAEHFFALVSLRLRASDPASSLLPPKVVRLILNELWWTLYAEESEWYYGVTTWGGPTDMDDGGVDRWLFKSDVEDMNFWDELMNADDKHTAEVSLVIPNLPSRVRRDRRKTLTFFRSFRSRQLIRVVGLFGLELLSISPRPLAVPNKWVSTAAIGLPAADHPVPAKGPSGDLRLKHLPRQNASRLDYEGEWPDVSAWRVVTSIGALPILPEEERRAFERLVSALRLERPRAKVRHGRKALDVDMNKTSMASSANPHTKSGPKQSRHTEPSLLVLHKVWYEH
jgi:hypothetical protein